MKQCLQTTVLNVNSLGTGIFSTKFILFLKKHFLIITVKYQYNAKPAFYLFYSMENSFVGVGTCLINCILCEKIIINEFQKIKLHRHLNCFTSKIDSEKNHGYIF